MSYLVLSNASHYKSKHQITIRYKEMSFNEDQQLVAINCISILISENLDN